MTGIPDSGPQAAAPPGRQVQVTFEVVKVTALPRSELLDGQITDPDPADPLTRYRRATAPVRIQRGRDTPIAMGKPAHLTAGALLRVHGKLLPGGRIDAEIIAVLSRFATLHDQPDPGGTEARKVLLAPWVAAGIGTAKYARSARCRAGTQSYSVTRNRLSPAPK